MITLIDNLTYRRSPIKLADLRQNVQIRRQHVGSTKAVIAGTKWSPVPSISRRGGGSDLNLSCRVSTCESNMIQPISSSCFHTIKNLPKYTVGYQDSYNANIRMKYAFGTYFIDNGSSLPVRAQNLCGPAKAQLWAPMSQIWIALR